VRRWLLVVIVGCGRFGFDPIATDSASGGSDSATQGAPPASCVALANDCGSTANDNCCSSLPVPGGAFARSYDVAADAMYPDATYIASVGDFALDKYKVTVGRFRAFVQAAQGTQANPPQAGAGAHPLLANSGWSTSWNAMLRADTATLESAFVCDAGGTWTPMAGSQENLPMTCVSWYEATAFCGWDGGFLPTEAEWNFAAAGGGEQRAYPWSSPPGSLAIDAMHASYSAEGTVIPVGNRPAGDGRFGQSDLAGNVWEWTLDHYATPYPTTPCSNCANLTIGTNWVVRGGSAFDDATNLRTGIRDRNNGVQPNERDADIGLRCARVSP